MEEALLTSVPNYQVRSANWAHLDVFDNKIDAMKATIELALKFSNTEFFVVQKLNWEESVIFKFKCDMLHDFDDSKEFYKSMISLFQGKLNETIAWRKSDGS